MEDNLFYTEDTKIKDLTVKQFKTLMLECFLNAPTYQAPLNCIGKELPELKTDTGRVYYRSKYEG